MTDRKRKRSDSISSLSSTDDDNVFAPPSKTINYLALLEREQVYKQLNQPIRMNQPWISSNTVLPYHDSYVQHVVNRLKDRYTVCYKLILRYDMYLFDDGIWNVRLDLKDVDGNLIKQAVIHSIIQDNSRHPMFNKDYNELLEAIQNNIQDCCLSKNYRFVLLKLGLCLNKVKKDQTTNKFVVYNRNCHANIILIDKINKTIERFDPQGKRENYSFQIQLNFNLIDKIIKDIKCDNILLTYTFLEDIHLQGAEPVETDEISGYCNPWSMLYFQRRVEYPNKSPHQIRDLIISDIYSKFKQQFHSDLESRKNQCLNMLNEYEQTSDPFEKKIKEDQYKLCKKHLDLYKIEKYKEFKLDYIRKYVESTKEPFTLECKRKLF